MKLTTELFATALTAIGGITTVALWGGRVAERVDAQEKRIEQVEPAADAVSRLDERMKAVEKKTDASAVKIDTLAERSAEQTAILRDIQRQVRK